MYQKKKRPWGAFFIFLMFMLVISYLFSGIFNVPDLSIDNFQESVIYAFTHPFSAWNEKTPGFLGLAVVAWGLLIARYLQFNRNYHPDLFGGSYWRDVKEANEYYIDEDNKHNRILTQNLKVSLRKGLANNNMAVIASSGDFKTTSLVEQNALQFGSAYIFLDVKGELQRKLGNAFKNAGYEVKSLNFNEPEKSDRYNPFVFIEKELDVLRAVKTLHESCRPMKSNFSASSDPFWDDAVQLLLQALFYAVWLESRETGKIGTINRLNELLNMESSYVTVPESEERVSKLQIYMDKLADKYGEDYAPVRDYRGLKDGAPDTVRSVVLMLRGMLKICNTAEVKRIFEENDINIRELGCGIDNDPNRPMVLFLVMPALNNPYNWIINMFYDQTFDILQRTSNFEIGGPLPIRVEFWMDEVYTGPKPTDLVELLGIVRGWNISIVLILQSIAQMEDMFEGAKWKVVVDNLAIVLFLGSGPMAAETHEYISKATGLGTFDLMTDSLNSGTSSSTGINWSQKERALLLPDDVKNLPPTDAIVFIKSSMPIYDTKAIPFDKPEYDYYAPKWLKERYSNAMGLGKYKHPVYTIYDAENFHYITIKRDIPFQIVTDKKEIESLQRVAFKKEQDVYTFNVNEEELLYLSWGENKYTQEDVEMMYNKAMEDKKMRMERMKGLIVLQNVDNVPNFGRELLDTDKTDWDKHKSLKALIAAHWDDLSLPEQEEICIGIDEGLTEEQLRMLMLRSLSEMAMLRRAFVLENQKSG